MDRFCNSLVVLMNCLIDYDWCLFGLFIVIFYLYCLIVISLYYFFSVVFTIRLVAYTYHWVWTAFVLRVVLDWLLYVGLV